MSELKAINLNSMGCYNINEPIYLKSEADKVIAELKAQVHDYAQGLYVMQARAEMELRHSNHKRCLAMARWCEAESDVADADGDYEDMKWYQKWHNKWLELAEEPTWAKFLQLIHKEEK